MISTVDPSQPSTQYPTFTIDPSLSAFQLPPKTYLSTLPNDISNSTSLLTPRFIAVGALTFDSHSRILLIQRASTDSMPHLWEIPGGGCDEDDPTILHSVARELEEEAGLRARHVWAAEEEVRAGRVGGVDIKFTTAEQKQVILDAFQVRRTILRGSAAGVEGGIATG
ncbi:hypothetical protein LTR70_004570 [Exophiala xenobiotica]|uniref:Nudix hydrolase domain-containing protein n=1 Tax=Lithohypha guttulata TaxID=1690604 RepID=A0ABR0KDB3_9EURO|nr:hypothetical protein LTR24_004173 [Lithohypha guttulata]KAK5320344.1 hypothetical protein LTR70_004570 [Exophiala xenobiotica]